MYNEASYNNQQQQVLNDRFDDIYLLTKNPFPYFLRGYDYNMYMSGRPSFDSARAPYSDPRVTPDNQYPGLLASLMRGTDLLERWPSQIKDDNPYLHPVLSCRATVYTEWAPQVSYYDVELQIPSGPNNYASIPGVGYAEITPRVRSVTWQWIRERSTIIRPGLKNLQTEWLNRVAHECMNRACGRELPFRPPYFLYTWPMANNLISVDVGIIDITHKSTPTFTGNLINQNEAASLDPWAKMMQGLEHQVFMYGDGDETLPAVNGKYRWPFGLSMPIPPTVGNIYVHLIQNYLIQVARDMGGASLSEPVMNSLDTNFALAVVWPESPTSAQVAIGNYAIYGGYGLTYGHPEGPYAGKVFKSDGTVDDAEMRGMMRDVAAYANRQRQIWINQNQAIYQKTKQVVEAGGDLYGLNISQIMDSRIVVTDDGGKVVDVTGSTTITGGTGQGNVVNTEPVTGSNFDTTDYTPGDKNPLEVSKVQVVSLTQNTISSGTGATVSVARDTSPGLVMAQPGSAAAQVIKEAAEARGESVTSEPEKSSFIPVAALLAIAASLFS